MREAAPTYRGKKVFLDHPDRENIGADRKFRDWVGVVENAEFRGDGIYGDIRLRTQSEHFQALLEAAESFDGFFGMSHVADGESRFEHGDEIIEAITDVFSVDIVTEPATAAGLFEGGPPADVEDDQNRNGIPDVLEADDDLLAPFHAALKEHGDSLPREVVAAFRVAGPAIVTIAKYAASIAPKGEPVQESYRRGDSQPYEFQAPWMRKPIPDERLRRFAARH
jgi:hypothetical protein